MVTIYQVDKTRDAKNNGDATEKTKNDTLTRFHVVDLYVNRIIAVYLSATSKKGV